MTGAVEEDLERLATELWPSEDLRVGLVRPLGPTWRGFAIVVRHGALALVPLDDRRASASAVTRWTEADSIRDFLVRGSAWVAARTGAAGIFLKDRVEVRARSDGDADQTLHEFLAGAIGVPRVELSCWFGSRRPNQKPVVRIHSADDGTTIAFAKVGWDPLTSSLVTNEADFLDAHADVRLRTFVIPRVLHRGTWNQRTICITSPVLGSPTFRSRPPDAEVLEEIAGLDGTQTGALSTSSYLGSVHERLEGLTSKRWVGLRRAVAILEQRWGEDALRFGRWHGDWAPWNMARRRRELIVWDWERTTADAPVGWDVLHHGFHEALRSGRSDPVGALTDALRAAGPTLERLGVGDRQRGGLACLYAVEMQLRFASELGPAAEPWWLDGLVEGVLGRSTA